MQISFHANKTSSLVFLRIQVNFDQSTIAQDFLPFCLKIYSLKNNPLSSWIRGQEFFSNTCAEFGLQLTNFQKHNTISCSVGFLL